MDEWLDKFRKKSETRARQVREKHKIMVKYEEIAIAHENFVKAIEPLIKFEFTHIPISIISVDDTIDGQVIVFDEGKFDIIEISTRLRKAADLVQKHVEKTKLEKDDE